MKKSNDFQNHFEKQPPKIKPFIGYANYCSKLNNILVQFGKKSNIQTKS